MNVWIAWESSGSYSDYTESVVGVFSTEESARLTVESRQKGIFEAWHASMQRSLDSLNNLPPISDYEQAISDLRYIARNAPRNVRPAVVEILNHEPNIHIGSREDRASAIAMYEKALAVPFDAFITEYGYSVDYGLAPEQRAWYHNEEVLDEPILP